jgi:glutamate--cysteine ligase
MAVPALWAGLLYDAQALAQAEELVAPITHAELVAARPHIAQAGLGADLAGKPLRPLAMSAIEIALEGLARRAERDHDGLDERKHLEPIAALTAAGKSPADLLLENLDAGGVDVRGVILDRTAM